MTRRSILLSTASALFLTATAPAFAQDGDAGLFTPVTPGDPASAAQALGIRIPISDPTPAPAPATTPAPSPGESAAIAAQAAAQGAIDPNERDLNERRRLRDDALAVAQTQPRAPEEGDGAIQSQRLAPPDRALPVEPAEAFGRSQPRNVVNVAPSRTEIIPLAAEHLNRIVTPFTRPVIQTVATEDEMQTRIEGNIIYVALSSTQTIFVHEEGRPDAAIGLALVPRMIPPREIVLNASGTSLASRRGDFERSLAAPSRPPVATGRATPHVQQLHDILVEVARGHVPDDFQLYEQVSDVRPSDICRADLPVRFDFSRAQMMVSDTHVVLIARAVLQGSRPIDLEEVWCAAQPATVGVAFYPRTELVRQGQDTEVYVVLARDQYEEQRPTRARLVSGE